MNVTITLKLEGKLDKKLSSIKTVTLSQKQTRKYKHVQPFEWKYCLSNN